MASFHTVLAAALALGESMWSSHSNRVKTSPSRIAREVLVPVVALGEVMRAPSGSSRVPRPGQR